MALEVGTSLKRWPSCRSAGRAAMYALARFVAVWQKASGGCVAQACGNARRVDVLSASVEPPQKMSSSG
eukprot:4207608-Alexandrium_andersonii.AAC.1